MRSLVFAAAVSTNTTDAGSEIILIGVQVHSPQFSCHEILLKFIALILVKVVMSSFHFLWIVVC